MPDPGSPHLIACDTLAEAQALSARVRAGLPVLGSDSPMAGSAAGRGRSDVEGAADPRQHLAALQYRLDRLEQAFATAGTFA
jgi:hypothetical protein